MKIRWYEILILALTALCALLFLGTYFSTVQAPGAWISTERWSPLPEDKATGGDPEQAPSVDSEPGRVDLNTASQSELEALPGIGAEKAAAIVEYRADHGPFRSVDELLNVDGIGEKTLAQIRGAVTVSNAN